jgi:hypothetical protein
MNRNGWLAAIPSLDIVVVEDIGACNGEEQKEGNFEHEDIVTKYSCLSRYQHWKKFLKDASMPVYHGEREEMWPRQVWSANCSQSLVEISSREQHQQNWA